MKNSAKLGNVMFGEMVGINILGEADGLSRLDTDQVRKAVMSTGFHVDQIVVSASGRINPAEQHIRITGKQEGFVGDVMG